MKKNRNEVPIAHGEFKPVDCQTVVERSRKHSNISNTLIWASAVAMILLMITAFAQDTIINHLKNIINNQDTLITIKTDTLYLERTITDSIPVERYITIIKRDTLYNKQGDSIIQQPRIITLKAKHYTDTIKEKDDTLVYQLKVEGYSMDDNDSLPRMTDFKALYKHKYYQTNTNTTITAKVPQKQSKCPLRISPLAGIGYGLTKKEFDAFVGLGISINF